MSKNDTRRKYTFPAMVSIANETPSNFPKDQISSTIQAMELEHEEVGILIKEITVLTNNFTPPSHACNASSHSKW